MRRWDVRLAARFYGIPLVDYCGEDVVWVPDPDRWGVLLGSGCGLMMGVMDVVPFRYCVDTDTLNLRDPLRAYQLAQFCTIAAACWDGGVALAGWFSISDPAPLREAFAGMNPPGVVYAGTTRLGVPGEVDTLQQFLAAAKARWSPFS